MVNYAKQKLELNGEMNNSNFINQNGQMSQVESIKSASRFMLPPCNVSREVRILSDGSQLEGIFINGSLVGQGIKHKNGIIEYKGEFLRGLYCGYGELFYPSGQVYYKGEFLNGFACGQGELYRPNGVLCYKGGFRENLFNGYGELYYESGNLLCKGNFLNNQYNGIIECYYENGSLRYKGEAQNGNFHGEGLFVDVDGTKYKGRMFFNNNINGYGLKQTVDGLVYEGTFYCGVLNGPVKVYFPNGNYCTGYSLNNKIFGKCYLYDSNNNLLEIAELVDGVFHGNGVEYKKTSQGYERYEYFAINGQKTYTTVLTKESVYWDIIFSPYMNNRDHTINPHQSYEIMIDALMYKAKFEVDIISPWIGEWIIKDKVFIKALQCALNRGVNVKIVTGIGQDGDNDKRRKKTIGNMNYLKSIFSNSKGKLSSDIRNTHEKYLLCDDDFMLSGSHNLLSYRPNQQDNRIESMKYDTDSNIIHETRVNRFNF